MLCFVIINIILYNLLCLDLALDQIRTSRERQHSVHSVSKMSITVYLTIMVDWALK